MAQTASRLTKQLNFILEIDRLKEVYRQNRILDGSRRENGAEHSWHIAAMAVVLQEYAAETVDLVKVLKMALLHDLVEIDAGDTFCYDEQARLDKGKREAEAAQRIYALLPADQEQEFKELWAEFEAGESAEAKFASCLDRLQPFLINYHIGGGTWQSHPVRSHQVRERVAQIETICPALSEFVNELIDDAVARGFLEE